MCAATNELFVVARDEKGATVIRKLTQDTRQVPATRGVQRRGRFIHQQHLRPHRQRTSNGDALRFTA